MRAKCINLFPGQGAGTKDLLARAPLKSYPDLQLKSHTPFIEDGSHPVSIFLRSIALYRNAKKLLKQDCFEVEYYAGHSLGEFSALCAANVISADECSKLVLNRQLMLDALPKSVRLYGMHLIISGDPSIVQEMSDSTMINRTVFISAVNSPTQIVMAGLAQDIRRLILPYHGRVRAIELGLPFPYHTPLLLEKMDEYRTMLTNTRWSAMENCKHVYSNVTGELYSPRDFIETFSKHLYMPVLWSRILTSAGILANEQNPSSSPAVNFGPGRVAGEISTLYNL